MNRHNTGASLKTKQNRCGRCDGNIVYKYDGYVCLQCARAPGNADSMPLPRGFHIQVDAARKARRAYYRKIGEQKRNGAGYHRNRSD
ncbi:MAG: hypothetical protein OXC95_17360 [Dehalococcoidia bacterium]|nr:hypothetical protein [Dehalococcoidia bacterium]